MQLLRTDHLSGDIARAADRVSQTHLDTLFAVPEQPAEKYRFLSLQSVTPAGFHRCDEVFVQALQQILRMLSIERAERAERVEDALVFPRGQQATLDTQFVHRIDKTEIVHQSDLMSQIIVISRYCPSFKTVKKLRCVKTKYLCITKSSDHCSFVTGPKGVCCVEQKFQLSLGRDL